jgi:low molecular weight protein-tyrosine phosphatase
MDVTGDRFEILFVCHANLCRSPMAERLARRALDDAFGSIGSSVVVSSAGTHAYGGSPMHPGSAAVLAECGVDAGRFVTRTVDASVLMAADLVLCAERDQRARCVALAPGTMRRAFTLLQFARLAAAVPAATPLTGPVPDRLRALVDRVVSGRHLVPTGPAQLDDLRDPVDRPIEEFRQCAQEIWQSVSTVVGVIAVP